MPGTIQVSVLDFKGLHSSSSSSQMSIKVSLGKTEYQTWDKGDFSFPLTTLRDDLIITLQDAEGNEISHTGIGTKMIVEKGIWDEIFPLEGGGHVHMKLQFVLNEEERQRIRDMRESALKKKHDELCNRSKASLGSASVRHNVAKSMHMNQDVSDKKESSSTTTDSSSKPAISVNHKLVPLRREEDVASEPKKLGPVEKNHSNVRKMISVFESSSLSQDKKVVVKPPLTKSELRKTGIDSMVGSSHVNEIGIEKNVDALSSLDRFRNPSITSQLQQDKTYVWKKGEQYASKNNFNVVQKEVGDLRRASRFEKAAFSGGEASNDHKLNSAAFWNDDRFSIASSGLWIFPDEAKCLCITSGGKKVMDLLGDIWTETNTYQRKMGTYEAEDVGDLEVFKMHHLALSELNEEKKSPGKLRKPSENSAHAEDSRGPVGQVLRIAIMVGFAALVLLTRQRKYR
ncbi:hypothetical protein SLE2022_268710 [Rubroshorea leprosula]